ncbi:hypothetical protein N483_24990 [Pseudoalteromonas luteoviolacea NCIMB 1944]|nr:hypothetical protein N483_24990 [Pseudoalteromonas luteoviolacea NCIMB 1944]
MAWLLFFVDDTLCIPSMMPIFKVHIFQLHTVFIEIGGQDKNNLSTKIWPFYS